MTRSEFPGSSPSISSDDLEQESGTLIPRNTLRLRRLSPLPDYLKHRDGVPSVGFLSVAEAVAGDFEAAAIQIEAMGPALVGAASKCEAITADVHKAIASIHETATGYRDCAREILFRIEECATLSGQLRSTCEKMRNKVADGPEREE